MKIFKFGGASVQDAAGVKNVAKILQQEKVESTIVVVSAMGKMTNALEAVIHAYYFKEENFLEKINFIERYHQKILQELFNKQHPVFNEVNYLLGALKGFLATNTSLDYNYVYDQVVCFGELISTKIVSNYLTTIAIENTWIDVRNYIKTDSSYRDANVHWELTEKTIQQKIIPKKLYLTQGFLGGNNSNQTTTLGREGSDYTAAIFAYCLQATSVTIWKDVAGVLNADPRVFKKTTLLNQISYEEAIEMAFYGASVIHPKTLQPLQREKIPLWVRSFKEPSKTGTKISKGVQLEPYITCFIVKKKQVLLAIATKNFSFMVENNISYIFKQLHKSGLQVNLIQNSAISFSVCIDTKLGNFEAFLKELQNNYIVDYKEDVDIYTVRHFNDTALEEIYTKGTPLLTQINKETAQIIVKTLSFFSMFVFLSNTKLWD